MLKNTVTNELYTNTLTIHEVNIKHINDKNVEELQVLKKFFEIETKSDFDKFSDNYGNTHYGKLLLSSYVAAIREDMLLESLAEEDKYMIRLTDEERLQKREEGRQEGRIQGKIKIAINLLNKNMSLPDISQVMGLSEREIEKLQIS